MGGERRGKVIDKEWREREFFFIETAVSVTLLSGRNRKRVWKKILLRATERGILTRIAPPIRTEA